MILLKKHWPIIISNLLLLVVSAIIILITVGYTDGKVIYHLDDPYIHMNIAKNLAEHGVWGINSDEFSSTSSSPLWTLILAFIYLVFGVNEIAPLVMNLLFALALNIGFYILLSRYIVNAWIKFCILFLLIFSMPLPALIFSGLEHVLQSLIVLFFLHFSSVYISSISSNDNKSNVNSNRKYFNRTLLFAVTLTAVRYEGLFMVFVVCVYLFIKRQLQKSIVLGLVSLIPPSVLGLISILHDWPFLPNSVRLKGQFYELSSFNELINFVFRDISQLYEVGALLILVALSLVTYLSYHFSAKKPQDERIPALVIFLFTAWFHLQFANITVYFRYEGYLVMMGIYMVAVSLSSFDLSFAKVKCKLRQIPVILALAACAVIILYPFLIRSFFSACYIPRRMMNIYGQQYQMGLFLERFYNSKTVVLNDIGAVGLLAEINLIDIWGLGNRDYGKAILDGNYNEATIDSIARFNGAGVAVIYDDINRMYNAGGVPSTWHKVGWWTIPNNNACFNATVSFYAIDETEIQPLRSHLIEYNKELPNDIAVGIN